MCGRYMITSTFEAMADLFEATLAELGPDQPRLNVSPTETVPVAVSHDGDRTLVPMRWGFLPAWYRAANERPLIINARAEEVAEKAAFRAAVRERRCLLPASGFYEWQGDRGARTPFVVRPRTGGLIAFAGIWQAWRGLPTCAIVTCPANGLLAPIHDRRGRSILSVRDQHTFDEALRMKRLMTLVHLYLIHRYRADSVHYVSPTEDNRYQTTKMKKHGIFSEVNTEVGQIIVADVDLTRIAELLAPDHAALLKLIRKED